MFGREPSTHSWERVRLTQRRQQQFTFISFLIMNVSQMDTYSEASWALLWMNKINVKAATTTKFWSFFWWIRKQTCCSSQKCIWLTIARGAAWIIRAKAQFALSEILLEFKRLVRRFEASANLTQRSTSSLTFLKYPSRQQRCVSHSLCNVDLVDTSQVKIQWTKLPMKRARKRQQQKLGVKLQLRLNGYIVILTTHTAQHQKSERTMV